MFYSFIRNVEHRQLLPADPKKRGKMSIRHTADLISSGVETGTLWCRRSEVDLSHTGLTLSFMRSQDIRL